MKELKFKKIADLLNWIKKETGVKLITVNEIENNEINEIKEIDVFTETIKAYRNYLKLIKLEKKLNNLIEFHSYGNNNRIKIVLNY